MMRLPPLHALDIPTLGAGQVPSPVYRHDERYVDETQRIVLSADVRQLQPLLRTGEPLPSFALAGPRASLFFDPGQLTCGIVTCGGLCPGLNNTIRSLVLTLYYTYGVRRILGFRYGYAGLVPQSGYAPWLLTPETVDTIHEHGGTLLGSSRGQQDVGVMVETLVQQHVQLLFAIGGDGTLRGAEALHHEITRRGLPIAVIGVPKTIDNDLQWIERSFGFATAVEEARQTIAAAHAEARGAWNGIGLVKLMGRHAGFIAAHASLANSDVNFCLVPEVPFALHGTDGFCAALERRLQHKHHAVIVVAEGAGQELMPHTGPEAYDASGNPRLHDIGSFLQQEILAYFRARNTEITLKYLDPSYSIRSLPANALDAAFCLQLAQHAVHAGMAGYSNMMVSYWNQHFVHVPLALAVAERRCLDPLGETWQSVLEATGQPQMSALPDTAAVGSAL